MGKWEMVRLGDVFPYIRNGASIQQNKNVIGYPITRIETIANGTINRDKMGYAGIEEIKPYSAYVLQDGDILMSHINSVSHLGKVAIYNKQQDETLIHGMNLLNLRADCNHVESLFAYYFFTSHNFKKQIPNITKNSVNQSSFNITALKELQMPLPPLDVQKRITDVLDCAAALIEKRKVQIAKLDLLVKSQFAEMFVEGKYPMVKLEDICGFITKGTTPPTNKLHSIPTESSIPYLKVYNLSDSGELHFWEEPQYVDIESHNALLVRSKIYPDDVLMNIVGLPLGKFALVTNDFAEWNINQAIAIFRSKEKVLPIYLLNAMMRPNVLRPFLDKAVGIRQINLSLTQCRKLEIPLPPLDLQQQFADFVRTLSRSRKEMQLGLDKLELLYTSLIQKCFAGELIHDGKL